MNGRRKPRVPRPCHDPIEHALRFSTRYTAAEVKTMLDPVRNAHQALRTGVGQETDWALLASTTAISLSIERKGVVRGLQEHLNAADQALAGIKRRAMANGEWQPTALYFQELDLITLLLELHEYQLGVLSVGEFEVAYQHAVAETIRVGGTVLQAHEVLPSTAAEPTGLGL